MNPTRSTASLGGVTAPLGGRPVKLGGEPAKLGDSIPADVSLDLRLVPAAPAPVAQAVPRAATTSPVLGSTTGLVSPVGAGIGGESFPSGGAGAPGGDGGDSGGDSGPGGGSTGQDG